MKTRQLLLAAAGLVVAASAFAWPGEPPPPPPPPPPPELNDCSPGFWKNHQEYWATQFCGGSECVAYVMGELTFRGPGERRLAMAVALNSWADSYYRTQVCTD